MFILSAFNAYFLVSQLNRDYLELINKRAELKVKDAQRKSSDIRRYFQENLLHDAKNDLSVLFNNFEMYTKDMQPERLFRKWGKFAFFRNTLPGYGG